MVGALQYPISSIYPGWGNGVNQTDETQPDPSEHAAYGGAEGSAGAFSVDKNKQFSMVGLLIIAVVLLFILR